MRLQATPEFEHAARLAADRDLPVRTVLGAAEAAAHTAGLLLGLPVPHKLDPAP